MFKFKMLTKVLVAVFVLGQLIELNLNLCIALSIDLDAPSSSVKLYKTWQSNNLLDSSGGSTINDNNNNTGEQNNSDELTLASHMQASATTTTTIATTLQSEPKEDGEKRIGQGSISQTLESNGRFNYIGKISVGDKQQPFMVLFDLSSSAFWLPSSECKSVQCISRQQYNRLESATSEHVANQDDRLFDSTFGQAADTRVSSRLVRDTITIAGITIESQTFGEAIELTGESFASLPVDGVLGLGFKLQASATNASSSSSVSGQLQAVETPLERLHRMGLLKEPIFSLLIKSEVDPYCYSADNGELILGELAPDYQLDEITFVPVTHVQYWEFRLSSVALRQTYGGVTLEQACQFACPAILDTSSDLISGHFTDVDRLNRALGAYAEGNGYYRLSHCNLRLLPDLIFTIGGAEFTLTPEEYVIVRQVRGNILTCHSAIKVVDAEQYPFWILGEHFLKHHYVVFDYGQKRVGFAKSKSMEKEVAVDIYGRTRRKAHII